MPRFAFVISLALITACGGASLQTVSIRNATSRPIEELYVYPTGGARGTSRGALAPSESTQVKIKAGHVSVMAVSAKLKVDEHTRDQPSASQELELKSPTEVVFYDDGNAPPGIEQKGVIGVAFQIPKGKSESPDEGAPTPDAPQADPQAPAP